MQYLIPIIAFLGLPLAILLKRINPEEVKQAKPYLFFLEKLTIAIIILTLAIQNFTNNKFFYILILIGLLLGFLFKQTYLYLSLALLSLNPIIAILTFIHGLSKTKFNIIRNAILFILPFSLLLLNIDTAHTSAIAIGALATFLRIK
tara:strand:+ start:1072 stop:1512 length:441 start_codon:yes stop_codon:yes gene_type:complete